MHGNDDYVDATFVCIPLRGDASFGYRDRPDAAGLSLRDDTVADLLHYAMRRRPVVELFVGIVTVKAAAATVWPVNVTAITDLFDCVEL